MIVNHWLCWLFISSVLTQRAEKIKFGVISIISKFIGVDLDGNKIKDSFNIQFDKDSARIFMYKYFFVFYLMWLDGKVVMNASTSKSVRQFSTCLQLILSSFITANPLSHNSFSFSPPMIAFHGYKNLLVFIESNSKRWIKKYELNKFILRKSSLSRAIWPFE